MIEITEKDGALFFRVKAVPRASKSALAGEFDGAVKVRIASPPVDGAANDELVRFLAKTLGIPKSNVAIVGGASSKSKLIRVEGIGHDEVADAFGKSPV